MDVTRKMQREKILQFWQRVLKTLWLIWCILFEGSDHTAFALAGYAKWVRLDGKDNLLEWTYVSDTMKEAAGASWQQGRGLGYR